MADLTPMTLGGVRCLTRAGGVRGGVFTCALTVASLTADSSLSDSRGPSESLKAAGAGRISGGWTAGAVEVPDGDAATGDGRGTEAGGGLLTWV